MIEPALRSAGIVDSPGSTLTKLAGSGVANLGVSANEPVAATALTPYDVLIGQLRLTSVVKDLIAVRRHARRRRR